MLKKEKGGNPDNGFPVDVSRGRKVLLISDGGLPVWPSVVLSHCVCGHLSQPCGNTLVWWVSHSSSVFKCQPQPAGPQLRHKSPSVLTSQFHSMGTICLV